MPIYEDWKFVGPSVLRNGQIGPAFDTAPASGRATALAVDSNDPDNTVYVGTAGGGVWKTTDGGITWHPKSDFQASLAIGAIAIDSTDTVRVYAGTGEQNVGNADIYYGRGLLGSDDGGDTWTRLPAATYTVGAGDSLSNIVAGPLKDYYTDWHQLYSDNKDIVGGDPNQITQGQVLRAVFPFARRVRITQIVVDDKDGSHLYLGTMAGLWESSDRGITWSLVRSRPGSPEPSVNAIALDTTGPKKRLYVAYEGIGIYARDDANALALLADSNGKLPVPAPGRIALSMFGDNHQILFAAFAKPDGTLQGIYKSSNAGGAWEPVLPPPGPASQTFYNFVLAVHPKDATRVYFGETKLWRSRALAGKITAWDQISDPKPGSTGIHSDQHALAFNLTKPDRIWVANDGGVWLSLDGGDTWSHRNRGLQTTQFYTLAQHPTWDSVLLAGAQDNGAQRGEGGPAWLLTNGGDACFTAIDPVDPKWWYHGGVGGPGDRTPALRRSDSAGNLRPDGHWGLWTDKAMNVADPMLPLAPFAMDISNPATLYLGTDRVYKYDSHGDSSAAISAARGAGNEVSALTVASADVVYVGTRDGKLFCLKRPVGGVPPWVTTDCTSTLPGIFVSDIAVNPGNANEVFVTISTFPYPLLAGDPLFLIQHIWHTSDGTASPVVWDDLGSRLPTKSDDVSSLDNPANSVAVNPSDPTVVLVGCDLGVYRSDDGGATWTNWSDGLPNSPVMDVEVHNRTQLVRVATHGRGVWERPIKPIAAAGPTTDIYLRENAVDVGRRIAPPAGPVIDPFDGSPVDWDQSPDIKVDTADEKGMFAAFSSTVDYTPLGNIDYLGFQALASANPRRKMQSRVFVQVHNRGSKDATKVNVHAFWADATTGVPALPATDFWSNFPADPADTSVWQPLGAVKVIDPLRPGEPSVVIWQWTVPPGTMTKAAIVAVIDSAEDADVKAETGLDLKAVVPLNKHVAVRTVSVDAAPQSWLRAILQTLGLAKPE